MLTEAIVGVSFGPVGSFIPETTSLGLRVARSEVSFGPVGSFIPEIFATAHRYTGVAFVSTVGGIIGGAVPPMIAGVLLAAFGSVAICVMMAVAFRASLVCTYLLPETMGTTLTDADAGQGCSAGHFRR